MSGKRLWNWLKSPFTTQKDYSVKPIALKSRSNTFFILSTVGLGLFTDFFLYGLVVPVLPYLLQDRIHVNPDDIQAYVSGMLAAYAAAAVVFAPVCGIIADKAKTRQNPFLIGLSALIFATVLLFTGEKVWVLVVARILQGASCAIVWTVGLALCVDTVGPENLGKSIGTIFSLLSFGELFAPFLGGLLYKAAGVAAVLGVSIGVLALDLIMRLFVIEKHEAAKYAGYEEIPSAQPTTQDDAQATEDGAQTTQDETQATATNADNSNNDDAAAGNSADETASTLSKASSHSLDPMRNDFYLIPKQLPWIIEQVPVLYCLKSPSLILATLIAFVQAVLYGAYDATVPTHAIALWNFDSLSSGLLFGPAGICNLIIGPIGGWAVDRYGTKPLAVIGFFWLVPFLALLRLPKSHPFGTQVALYAVLLGANGVGMGEIGSPAMVEAGIVVDKFHQRNRDVFGERGPYATLYALNTITFCAGLTIGPVLAGGLVGAIGYGNMNACLAVLSGVSGVACYVWLGGKPKHLKRWWRRRRRARREEAAS